MSDLTSAGEQFGDLDQTGVGADKTTHIPQAGDVCVGNAAGNRCVLFVFRNQCAAQPRCVKYPMSAPQQIMFKQYHEKHPRLTAGNVALKT